ADRERRVVPSVPTALLPASPDCQVRRWFYFFSNTSRSSCATQPAIPPHPSSWARLLLLAAASPDLARRCLLRTCSTTPSSLGLARRIRADRSRPLRPGWDLSGRYRLRRHPPPSSADGGWWLEIRDLRREDLSLLDRRSCMSPCSSRSAAFPIGQYPWRQAKNAERDKSGQARERDRKEDRHPWVMAKCEGPSAFLWRSWKCRGTTVGPGLLVIRRGRTVMMR
ncbi:hypothetical protein MAPG_10960, partial [Magnaporthiopsis poae ATCC 64411]|uniref:Uncharacterized protein n=1 Tax=Magnaporthiopsis poae (strain ATCC 64411 / 73-15) TaxID=644358 RepID=A0A0C4EE00_MAGP6